MSLIVDMGDGDATIRLGFRVLEKSWHDGVFVDAGDAAWVGRQGV